MALSFLLLWPEVRTEEEYEKVRSELHPTTMLYERYGRIRTGIDLIFFWQWKKLFPRVANESM